MNFTSVETFQTFHFRNLGRMRANKDGGCSTQWGEKKGREGVFFFYPMSFYKRFDFLTQAHRCGCRFCSVWFISAVDLSCNRKLPLSYLSNSTVTRNTSSPYTRDYVILSFTTLVCIFEGLYHGKQHFVGQYESLKTTYLVISRICEWYRVEAERRMVLKAFAFM